MIRDITYKQAVEEGTYSNSTLLSLYINDRLCHYGYGRQNSPDKYNAYASVRRVVSLRLGRVIGKGKFALSDSTFNYCIQVVDEVLPLRS